MSSQCPCGELMRRKRLHNQNNTRSDPVNLHLPSAVFESNPVYTLLPFLCLLAYFWQYLFNSVYNVFIFSIQTQDSFVFFFLLSRNKIQLLLLGVQPWGHGEPVLGTWVAEHCLVSASEELKLCYLEWEIFVLVVYGNTLDWGTHIHCYLSCRKRCMNNKLA